MKINDWYLITTRFAGAYLEINNKKYNFPLPMACFGIGKVINRLGKDNFSIKVFSTFTRMDSNTHEAFLSENYKLIKMSSEDGYKFYKQYTINNIKYNTLQREDIENKEIRIKETDDELREIFSYYYNKYSLA